VHLLDAGLARDLLGIACDPLAETTTAGRPSALLWPAVVDQH
jgi:hypothetical protein